MKKFKIILPIVLLALVALLAFLLINKDNNTTNSQQSNSSATGVYLDPSIKEANVNQDLSFDVNVNSNQDSINVVSLKLSYDPSILQYESFENSSTFAIAVETKSENGVITVTRGAQTPGTGINNFGKVKFKAIKAGQTILDTIGTEVVSSKTNSYIDLQFGSSQVTVN